MRKIKFSLVFAVGIVLVIIAGFWGAKNSLSQSFDPTVLPLQENDLPDLYGTGWERSDAQTSEELAAEIAKSIGLSLNGTEFLEGQAAGFLTYSNSDTEATGVVQGLYRYDSERAARGRYGQWLQQGIPLMGRDTSVAAQTEWSSGEAQGQLIEALDPVGSAYAYWFVGVKGNWVIVMQVWVCSSEPGPKPSDRTILMELLPKALKKLTMDSP